MKTQHFLVSAFLAVFFLSSIPSWAGGVTVLDKDDWKATLGGFVEQDFFYDTTRSFTEVVGNGPVARGGTFAGDNGRTQASLRNSRLAFGVTPPTMNGWKTRGYIETDFLGAANTSSEASYFTSPTLRLRHAYLSADKDGWTILSGQFWTLFGWQPYYVLDSSSVPPVSGLLYERTPQITVIKAIPLGSKDNALQIGASVNRPVQRDSTWPNVDAGLRLSFGGRKGGLASGPTGGISVQPMSIALSGTMRQFESPVSATDTLNQNKTTGFAAAAEALIPIIPSTDGTVKNTLTLTGEATTGQGYSDEFPGYSGNLSAMSVTTTPATPTDLDAGLGGYNSTGAFELVKLQTWNLQLQYHLPTEMNMFLTLGYGQLYSSNVGAITSPAPSGVPYDRAETLFANFFKNFTNQIRASIGVEQQMTHYVDGNIMANKRVILATYFLF